MLIPNYALFSLMFFMLLLVVVVVILLAQSIGNEKIIAKQNDEIGYLRGVLDSKEEIEYRLAFRGYLRSISKGDKQ